MEYEFKKNQKPFFMSIDWNKGELWDSVSFPIEQVKEIIPIIVKYAAQQGVKLEVIKNDDLVEFMIVKNSPTEFQECKNKILRFLKECGGSATKMDLNTRMKFYKLVLNPALESLIQENKIEKTKSESVCMGRPSTIYRLI